jgi:hypothetical protein
MRRTLTFFTVTVFATLIACAPTRGASDPSDSQDSLQFDPPPQSEKKKDDDEPEHRPPGNPMRAN